MTRPWIVTPHGPIEEIDDNLWGVVSAVPGFPKGTGMDRRMTIVRLGDGRLVFHNAVPLDDAAPGKVCAWGKPWALIVPMHLHSLDAPAFREKLGVAVYSSRATIERVRRSMPVEGTLEELPPDGALSREPIAGTKFGEAAWLVASGPRRTLLFCDAFQNSRPGRGFNGAMFKLLGFTGPGPRAPGAYKMRAVSDKAALRADLLRLADTPGLTRIVPSHGEIVEREPAEALRRVARTF